MSFARKPLTPFVLSRRSMLRGLAGGVAATVGLPVLDAMLNSHGTALAGGIPLPKRFVTFLFGNGVVLNRWTPATLGSAWELTPQLSPLALVKEYCTILSGFENKIQPITHHEGMAGMFSGHPWVSNGGGGFNTHFGGPSIDQVVADTLADGTKFRSIEIGISKRHEANEGPTMQFLAHRGPQTPLPAERSPKALFEKLFGTTLIDEAARQQRVTVLDAVREDARRLRLQLGTEDRLRLDSHLQAIRELQGQIQATSQACVKPLEPTEENLDTAGAEPMEEVNAAMTDLLVHAFSCDLSRVASYMLTGGVGSTVYSHLGQNQEQHIMSHAPVTYATELDEGITWNVAKFANLLQKLKDKSEGAGNLLDNSLLILGSDCAEGWNHSIGDMPVIVAGKAGGALVHPGIHLRDTADRNLSDILLTCVQAVAPTITEIGSDEGFSTTTVTQIRA